MRTNYGLYFNWWDRLMGTNHPSYEARFEAVIEPAVVSARERAGVTSE